jgi:phosphoglycerol transferase MdoB-like AlkP superfamily enzyme
VPDLSDASGVDAPPSEMVDDVAERRRLRVPRNLKFFLLLVALLSVHFALLRLGLIVRNRGSAADATAMELASSFLTGWRFDLSTSCYLLLPFIVVSYMPGAPLDRSPSHRRWFFRCFLAAMGLLTFLCLAEYEFFHEFQTRYNRLALQYLDQATTVAGMVWYEYPVVRYVLLWLAYMCAFALALRWVLRTSFDFAGPPPATAKRQWLAEVAAIAVVIGILIIGMRGGVQSEPLRWGNAYRTSNEFANQVSLNGLYTLGHTIRNTMTRSNEAAWWSRAMTLEEARRETRALLVEHGETLLTPRDRAVLRQDEDVSNQWLTLRKTPRRPNVVLVIMESFSARFVGAVGAQPDFTPEFTRLCADGVLFKRAFSSGTHTHQGVFSTMLSFPNLPGHEYLMEDVESNQPFLALPTLLKQSGYQTMFLYNGNLAWDNMQGFFRKQGIDTFVGGDSFDQSVAKDAVWGVSDGDLFARANDEFDRAAARGPFFSLVLTLSNHAPFDLPKPVPFQPTTSMGELNKRIDGLRYADWAIGQFIACAKTRAYFDNTLFVFVGDHGFHVDPKLTPAHLLYHHVPLLFYAPGLMEQAGVVRDEVVGQVNVAPSIIGLLGLTPPTAAWGRNAFSKDFTDANFAIVKGSGGDNNVVMLRGDRALVVDENNRAKLWRYSLGFPPTAVPDESPAAPETSRAMEHALRAYVQAALADLTSQRAGPARVAGLP